MEDKPEIRYGSLKGVYVYTAFGAGLSGLGMILLPETFASIWKCRVPDHRHLGIVGSVF